jgi:GNAT superfamily N-acetyltransferase
MIEVRIAKNLREFKECLALRYRVYNLLGYISDDRASESLDLDFFDPSAIHFIATQKANDAGTTRIAGTARLIVTGKSTCSRGFFGDTTALRNHYKSLCDEVAVDSSRLRRNLDKRPVAAALPVLAAFKSTPEGIRDDEVCELSRVVVSEEFRGLGLSRLLIRACIAAALDLRLRAVMLECLPEHVQLYAKFDFKTTPSSSPRPWGIDHQLLTAMRLDLDNPLTEAVIAAKRDIQMMREPRWLMLPPCARIVPASRSELALSLGAIHCLRSTWRRLSSTLQNLGHWNCGKLPPVFMTKRTNLLHDPSR